MSVAFPTMSLSKLAIGILVVAAGIVTSLNQRLHPALQQIVCSPTYPSFVPGQEVIQLTDTYPTICSKMSDHSKRAFGIVMRLLASHELLMDIHPMGGLGIVRLLDTYAIRGDDIVTLYEDVCTSNLTCVATTMTAVQFGKLPIQQLYCALQNHAILDRVVKLDSWNEIRLDVLDDATDSFF